VAELPRNAHEVYTTGDPPEDGPRARKHRLTKEVKRMIESVALLDVHRMDDDELASIGAQAAALADRLAAHPSLKEKGGLALAGGDDAALLERSGITGRSNPLAAPLQMWFEGQEVRGSAVYTDAYEGPPGCLHGGFVAAAFDDLLGFAQTLSGTAGYTGTFTIRYIKPTPLNRTLDYRAGVTKAEGRKIWCWGTCHDGADLLAEAEIVFITPKFGIPIPRP
jgi:acyl-coenzyme A thioesterase PaaI-like protein